MKVLVFIFLNLIKCCLTVEDEVSGINITPSSRSVLITGDILNEHTNYELKILEKDGNQFRFKKFLGPKDSITIDELEPCTDYVLNLKNEESIDDITKNFTTDSETIGHVLDISINETDELVKIDWEPPKQAPNCIDHYEVTATIFQPPPGIKKRTETTTTSCEFVKDSNKFKEPIISIIPIPKHAKKSSKPKIESDENIKKFQNPKLLFRSSYDRIFEEQEKSSENKNVIAEYMNDRELDKFQTTPEKSVDRSNEKYKNLHDKNIDSIEMTDSTTFTSTNTEGRKYFMETTNRSVLSTPEENVVNFKSTGFTQVVNSTNLTSSDRNTPVSRKLKDSAISTFSDKNTTDFTEEKDSPISSSADISTLDPRGKRTGTESSISSTLGSNIPHISVTPYMHNGTIEVSSSTPILIDGTSVTTIQTEETTTSNFLTTTQMPTEAPIDPACYNITEINVTNLYSTSALIIWTMEKDCDSISYEVNTIEDGPQITLDIFRTTDTKYFLKSLTPCKKYKVKVVTRDKNEKEYYKETNFATYPTNTDFKDKPKVTLGIHDISLSWSMKEKCDLINFDVSVKTIDTNSIQNITDANNSNTIIPNLRPCTWYTISISVKLLKKIVKKFNVGSYITYPEANSVSNLEVGNITSNQAHVFWTGPTNCNIIYSVTLTKAKIKKDSTTNDSHLQFSELESCTKYTVSVESSREKNSISKNLILDFYTNPKDEDFISNPSITPGITNVTVSWEKGQQCDFDFSVTLIRGLEPKPTKTKDTKITVPDLTPCTTYSVVIDTTFKPNSWSKLKNIGNFITYPANEEISFLGIHTTHDSLSLAWRRPKCKYFQYEYTVTIDNEESTTAWPPILRYEPSYKAFSNTTLNNYAFFDNLDPCTEYSIGIQTRIMNVSDWVAENIKTLTNITNTEANFQDKAILEIVPEINALNVSWNLLSLRGDACSAIEYNITIYDVEKNEIINGNTTSDMNYYISDYIEACTEYRVEVIPYLNNRQFLTTTENITTLYADPSNLEMDKPKESPGSNKNLFNLDLNWRVKTNPRCVESYNFVQKESEEIIRTEKVSENKKRFQNLKLCTFYNFTVETISKENITGETVFQTYHKPGTNDPPQLIGRITSACRDCKTRWRISDNNCKLDFLVINCDIIEPEENPECLVNEPTYFNLSEQKGGEFDVVLTDLSPWTNYSCNATVNNTEGLTSIPSGNFKFTTKEQEPRPPQNLKIQLEDHSLNISWDPPKCKRGDLTTYKCEVESINPLYSLRSECSFPNEKINPLEVLPTSNKCSFHLIAEYYSVEIQMSVTASTKVGASEKGRQLYTTKPGKPGPPVNLNYLFPKCNRVNLEWKSPCLTNGNIVHYEIVEVNQNIYENVTAKDIEEDYKIELDLMPNKDYNFTFYTKNTEYLSDASEPILFRSQPGIPELMTPAPNITKEIWDKNVTITTENIFDETNGEILYHAIFFSNNSDNIAEIKSDYWNCTGEPIWPANDSQITENIWNGTELVVKNLQPNTTYWVKIRGFTSTGYRDTNPIKIRTTIEILEPTKIDLGLVIGILAAVIVVTIIIAVVYKTKGRLRKLKNWPIVSRTRFFGSRNSTDSVSLNGEIKSAIPRPVLVSKFVDHYNQMIQNEGRISSEFQLLNTLCADITSSTREALLPPNRRKNRYINILPYDDNRVKLKAPMSSDYINASYIRGFSGGIEFIAAQGPTESTYPAFWRMIYDEDVKIIVMLTQLVEQNKEKCFKYYPDIMDEISFETEVGEMKVLGLIEDAHEIHTLRKLALIENGERKEVTHILFNKWPDFGVPTHVSHMLHFHKTVLKLRSDKSGVILVHCSAGVGRTGTLIALDILSQAVVRNRKVDIFNTVLNLRKQRMMMVQSEKQYEFLYKCIQQIIMKKNQSKNDKVPDRVKESGM